MIFCIAYTRALTFFLGMGVRLGMGVQSAVLGHGTNRTCSLCAVWPARAHAAGQDRDSVHGGGMCVCVCASVRVCVCVCVCVLGI